MELAEEDEKVRWARWTETRMEIEEVLRDQNKLRARIEARQRAAAVEVPFEAWRPRFDDPATATVMAPAALRAVLVVGGARSSLAPRDWDTWWKWWKDQQHTWHTESRVHDGTGWRAMTHPPRRYKCGLGDVDPHDLNPLQDFRVGPQALFIRGGI